MTQEQLELINRARAALDELAGDRPIRIGALVGNEARADRRRLIVDILRESPGGITNEHVLCRVLAGLGHVVSQDTLYGDVVVLADLGVLECDPTANKNMLVIKAPSLGRMSDASIAGAFSELFGGAK